MTRSTTRTTSISNAVKLDDTSPLGFSKTFKEVTAPSLMNYADENSENKRQVLEYIEQMQATLEAMKAALEATQEELDVATKQEEHTPTPKASRVKRSKAVDTKVEAIKGKRDVNAGDKQRIDTTKEAAAQFKPEPVQQAKRSTKKTTTPKAEKAQTKRDYNGMTYAQLRSEVSTRKAKLNKADQERMSKAGCKNNTWEGAILCIEWLNQYFPTK